MYVTHNTSSSHTTNQYFFFTFLSWKRLTSFLAESEFLLSKITPDVSLQKPITLLTQHKKTDNTTIIIYFILKRGCYQILKQKPTILLNGTSFFFKHLYIVSIWHSELPHSDLSRRCARFGGLGESYCQRCKCEQRSSDTFGPAVREISLYILYERVHIINRPHISYCEQGVQEVCWGQSAHLKSM